MLKALMGLAVSGVAALAIASPAAAAPVCSDANIYAYGSSFPSFASAYVQTLDHCDGSYDIVSVSWTLGSSYVYYNGTTAVTLDGVYTGYETAVITVTDGTDTDEFTLNVYRCFSEWPCTPF